MIRRGFCGRMSNQMIGPNEPPETSVASFKTAQASSTNLSSSPPLMVAERTYNTSHPDYDATIVRNFPAKILNGTLPSSNPAYVELKKLGTGDVIADEAWATLSARCLGRG